ncbi:MAG: 1-acyl-sn-glycerol-3-phosphate acyltransferase [bacterium]|nr:1-acyl-sn-glycerol-3-phosphate acyltransferase [bacterium]
MRFREKMASILAVLAFALIYTFLCWPTVCIVRFAGWLLRTEESSIRSCVAWCAHWWGHLTLSVVCVILRIKINVCLEGDKTLLYEHPCIVISNHQTTFDVAVMTLVMAEIGKRNARWVLKEELRRGSFVVGWIADRTGCAFVSRRRDPNDLQEIRRCARVLREDCAAVFLFPEGTRFTQERKTSSYSYVLPPKKAGFHIFQKELPNAPVVSVTLQWDPMIVDGTQGRTIYRSADFYGKTLWINMRVATPDEIRADPNWLETEWDRKDSELAGRYRVHP